MPRIAYIERSFSAEHELIIGQVNALGVRYQAQGLDLTLRQAYYRLVAAGVIPNTEQSYKRVGGIINQARLAGRLDWDHIVDRTRNMRSNSHWDTPADIIDSAARSYAEDKWDRQGTRVEVWVEKDALVGVLQAVCPDNDVAYFSCRGYTSQSEVWGAAQRLGEYIERGQKVVVIHLGDHDPSGVDMSRDIEDRLRMFIAQDQFGSPANGPDDYSEIYRSDTEHVLAIERIALNMDQVRQYNPPPNPAKITDSRAGAYIDRFGQSSWELDALEPQTLIDLIQDAIDDHKDPEAWDEAVEAEEGQRSVLTLAARRWADVATMLNGGGES